MSIATEHDVNQSMPARSDAGMSFLSEPHAYELFMQLPVPLAVLEHNGGAIVPNQCFTDTFFDCLCLNLNGLQSTLLCSYDQAMSSVSFRCNGCTCTPPDHFAHAVNVGKTTMLVFEKSDERGDNTALAELNQRVIELEKLCETDALTGAWNRSHFDKTMLVELNRSHRYRQPLTLLVIEIDHFGPVAATRGDEVLCKLTRLILKNIRPSDMLFRLADNQLENEQFVILAPSTSHHAAVVMAETLRAKIEQHAVRMGEAITASLGGAEHLAGEDARTFSQRADAALHAAIQGGRNRAVVDAQGNSDLWDAGQDAIRSYLAWDDAYDCGEPTLDQEHRELFAFANVLIDAALNQRADPYQFDAATVKLLAHLEQHFTDEEAILAQHRYAELDIHAHTHRMLTDRALGLRIAMKKGMVTIGEIMDFLVDEVVSSMFSKRTTSCMLCSTARPRTECWYATSWI